MDTQLSPEAVEALAKALAIKLGIKDRTDADLANQMFAFEQEDKKRQTEEQDFRAEVRDALRDLKRNKSDIPLMAISVAVIAAFFSVLSLIGTARATERLSNEIREIREHMVVSNGRTAP